MRRVAGLAGVAVLAALAAGGLLHLRAAGRQAIEASLAALAAYEQTAAGLPLDPVADADLSGLAPLLDRARDGRTGRRGRSGRTPARPVAGGKLAAGARVLYRHALGYALLPRLVWRLEAQMRGTLNQPELLYEATRVYLMLGGAGPLDRDLVRAWMTLDWQAAYPGDRLRRCGRPWRAISTPCCRAAAAGVRWMASWWRRRAPPSAGSRWRSGSIPGSALPPPRSACRHGGRRGAGRRRRRGCSCAPPGKPLRDGVPGFYTVEGFRKRAAAVARQAARAGGAESWVLGERSNSIRTGRRCAPCKAR